MMAPLRLSTIMVMTAWTLCLQSAQVAASIFDIQLQKASSTPLGEEDFGLIKHRSLASLIADDVAYLNFKYGNGDTFTVGAIGATVLDVINNRDRGYFVQVEIGSPPQRFNVVIDTGSSTLWVGASECGGNCNSANYFDNRASSTYAVAPRFRGAIGTISYGSGTITGRLVTDQVNLGNLNIRNQTFVEVTSQSSQLQRILNGQWDGILGLSYDGGPSAVNDYYGVFYSLVQTRAVTESVFCVWLNGSVDGQTYYTNGGRLVFGGIESSLYSGGITWMPLSHGSNAKRPYWSVTGRSISIGSNSIGAPSNTLVVVDSGTALMAFDDNTYQNIINAFRGTGLSLSCSSSNICTFDCGVARSLPTVTLNLNGNDFSLDPTDYVFYDRSSNVCSLGIQTVLASIGSGSDVYWIVGDVFLRKYMSFYDYGNSAVGLALSANRSPASLPPSLSGGSGGGSGGGTSSDGTGTGNGGGGSSPTSGGGSSSNNNNGGSGTTGSPGSGTGSGSSPAGTNGSSSGGGTSSSNNNSGGGASSNGTTSTPQGRTTMMIAIGGGVAAVVALAAIAFVVVRRTRRAKAATVDDSSLLKPEMAAAAAVGGGARGDEEKKAGGAEALQRSGSAGSHRSNRSQRGGGDGPAMVPAVNAAMASMPFDKFGPAAAHTSRERPASTIVFGSLARPANDSTNVPFPSASLFPVPPLQNLPPPTTRNQGERPTSTIVFGSLKRPAKGTPEFQYDDQPPMPKYLPSRAPPVEEEDDFTYPADQRRARSNSIIEFDSLHRPVRGGRDMYPQEPMPQPPAQFVVPQRGFAAPPRDDENRGRRDDRHKGGSSAAPRPSSVIVYNSLNRPAKGSNDIVPPRRDQSAKPHFVTEGGIAIPPRNHRGGATPRSNGNQGGELSGDTSRPLNHSRSGDMSRTNGGELRPLQLNNSGNLVVPIPERGRSRSPSGPSYPDEKPHTNRPNSVIVFNSLNRPAAGSGRVPTQEPTAQPQQPQQHMRPPQHHANGLWSAGVGAAMPTQPYMPPQQPFQSPPFQQQQFQQGPMPPPSFQQFPQQQWYPQQQQQQAWGNMSPPPMQGQQWGPPPPQQGQWMPPPQQQQQPPHHQQPPYGY